MHRTPLLRRYRSCLLAALAATALGSGCRLPGSDGPASRSLLTCRQLSQQGLSALERGDCAGASALLERAVASCPVDSEARRHYAEALWSTGRQVDAVAQLDEAIRLAPDDPALLVRAAEMRLAVGQIDFARAEAERAIDLDPTSARAWALRGQVRKQLGLLAEALADCHRALGYAPDDRGVLLELAELYRELGQPQRALASLQSLADTYPPGEEPQQVLFLTGLAYNALGRDGDAIEYLAAARDRGAASPEILYRLAESQWRAGHRVEASLAARQALAVEPGHAASLALLQHIQPAPGHPAGPPFR